MLKKFIISFKNRREKAIKDRGNIDSINSHLFGSSSGGGGWLTAGVVNTTLPVGGSSQTGLAEIVTTLFYGINTFETIGKSLTMFLCSSCTQ